MRKLRFSVEDLAVETFASEEPGVGGRGTVHGQESYYETLEGYSCEYGETCQHLHTCYMDCTMDCTFRPRCR